MTNQRLGSAAILAVSVTALLMVSPALAQRRGGGQRQQQQQQPSAAKQEKTFPLGASWTALTLNGKSVSQIKATLLIDSNLRGTGFSGCNTFSASAYPLREQGIAVGPVALTKRECGKEIMAFEKAYLLALRAARQWDLVEGRLVIKGGAGELHFDRGL